MKNYLDSYVVITPADIVLEPKIKQYIDQSFDLKTILAISGLFSLSGVMINLI